MLGWSLQTMQGWSLDHSLQAFGILIGQLDETLHVSSPKHMLYTPKYNSALLTQAE